MHVTEEVLFDKFQKLAKTVKQNFAKKGVAVPSKLKNGNILVGKYIIAKEKGMYYIKDRYNEVIIGPINLPQTAILAANDLALGKIIDNNLIQNDQWYGYKDFEEQVAKHSADVAFKKKDIDKADFSLYKASLALTKKQEFKKSIDARFAKLCKLT